MRKIAPLALLPLLAWATPASAQTTTLCNGRVAFMVTASQIALPTGGEATTYTGLFVMPSFGTELIGFQIATPGFYFPPRNIVANLTGPVVVPLGSTLNSATGGQPIPASTVANAASVASCRFPP